MIYDYKALQSNTEDFTPDSPYKPYIHEQRSPESPEKAAGTINAFYANKEQYEAFVRLVGKETAMLWMANLLERVNKK